MGIYPEVKHERKTDGDHRQLLVLTTHTPGLNVIETFVLESRVEDRTECFCCSCGDREGSDPGCRNHGWAGTRPCEVHSMPGSAWEDDGTMPDSVQAARGWVAVSTSDEKVASIEDGRVRAVAAGSASVVYMLPEDYNYPGEPESRREVQVTVA